MWPSVIPSAATNPNKLPWSVRCRGLQVDTGGNEFGPLRALEQTIIADFAKGVSIPDQIMIPYYENIPSKAGS